MRLRGWLILGALALPTQAPAQTVKAADLLGGWGAEFEHKPCPPAPSRCNTSDTTGAIVLWPDGLWWYIGGLMWHGHGGARWRLVGDTLWLGYDYVPYFHPMIGPRMWAATVKGHKDAGVIDMEIIKRRPPYPVPDSIYWTKTFRDTVSVCHPRRPGPGFPGGCGTWAYKVSKQGEQLSLTLIDSISRAVESVAIKATLTRKPLVQCEPVGGCDYASREDLGPFSWDSLMAQAPKNDHIKALLGETP